MKSSLLLDERQMQPMMRRKLMRIWKANYAENSDVHIDKLAIEVT